MGVIEGYIGKMKLKAHNYNIRKSYEKDRKEIIEHGTHSELMIDRPDGLERCNLILRSYDTPQLKEIKSMLENRGINSELLEDFNGGKTLYKFNLTPNEYSKSLDISKDFDKFLGFLDKYFVYGLPVKNINFFTQEEMEVLSKWYK